MKKRGESMTCEMNEPVVADVELILRLLCHFTDEQIAEMWERQLIPNRMEAGRRVAEVDGAVAYMKRVLARQLKGRVV